MSRFFSINICQLYHFNEILLQKYVTELTCFNILKKNNFYKKCILYFDILPCLIPLLVILSFLYMSLDILPCYSIRSFCFKSILQYWVYNQGDSNKVSYVKSYMHSDLRSFILVVNNFNSSYCTYCAYFVSLVSICPRE